MVEVEAQDSVCLKGALYVVATPIGHLKDITYRAREILQAVDYVAAEDKGYTRGLLSYLGVEKPMVSLRSENEENQVERVISLLKQGYSIALVSDAGTPVISDPGYRFIRALRQAGFPVLPVPGPCALIAALSVSGFSADRFSFEGFLPSKRSVRRVCLEAVKENKDTLVFYETPHRVVEVLEEMKEIFGGDRRVFIARELTKLFETFFSGSLKEALHWVRSDPVQQKGEFVLILEGKQKDERPVEVSQAVMQVLTILLTELSTKKAAHLGSKITGVSKRLLYAQAVQLKPEIKPEREDG